MFSWLLLPVGIHKDDKHKIKLLLRQLIPDLFFTPRQEMSDDEDDGKRRQLQFLFFYMFLFYKDSICLYFVFSWLRKNI